MIYKDTEKRLIKFTDEKSLLDNPSEIFHAAYLASKLNFHIASDALDMMEAHRKQVNKLSRSELRDELFAIFALPNSIVAIRIIDETGVLSQFVPEIEMVRGVKQNPYHHLDVWNHSLLALEEYEKKPIPEFLSDYSKELTEYFNTRIVYDKFKFQIIKYALLMHDIGKARTKRVNKNGWISFVGHEKVGADIAESIAMNLRFGGKSAKISNILIRNHLRTMLLNKEEEVTQKAIRRFIKNTKQDWLGVLLLSYFDLLASQGPLRTQREIETTELLIKNIADFFFQKLRNEICMQKLINAKELRKRLNIPSKLIGPTLKYIEDCQFNGEIHTRDQALKAAEKFLENTCKMRNTKVKM